MVASFFEYFIPFTVLLGTLVFIHELGHFLAARWFGVRVEVFSLGFGPKILKYKKGATTYCLSLIPLGGYVKMFGDNPRQEIPHSLKKEAFLAQKPWPKIAIALAGPMMNFFLAIVLFMIVFGFGSQKADPILGDIDQKSLAYNYGFRSGDKILSINDLKIRFWEEAQDLIQDEINQPLTFKVQSTDFLKKIPSIRTIVATPNKVKNTSLTALKSFKGEIKGLSVFSKSSHIGVSQTSSKAYRAGLRTFDEVKEIEGQKISNWRDLNNYLLYSPLSKKSHLTFVVQREGSQNLIPIEVPNIRSRKNFLKNLNIEKTDLFIDRVKKKGPADQAGLVRGDRLVSINGKNLKSFDDLSSIIQDYKEGSPAIEVTFLRKGQKKATQLKPENMDTFSVNGELKNRYMIGVGSAQYFSHPPVTVSKVLNPIYSFKLALMETVKWSLVTARVIGKLIVGSISPRVMGGPISIAKVAKTSFSDSFIQFLITMAIISVNLFLINLLPIPVLDGGHLMIFTLEAIKGRPLSIQKIEKFQIAGFLIIMFFIVFTIFNDIQNWNIIW